MTETAAVAVAVAAGVGVACLLSVAVQRAVAWPEPRRSRFAVALLVSLAAAAWGSTALGGAAAWGLAGFVWAFVLLQAVLLPRGRARTRPRPGPSLPGPSVPRPRAEADPVSWERHRRPAVH